MDSKYEAILSAKIPPLIPEELLKEYSSCINNNIPEVLRATSLRRYLEGAIDLIFKDIILEKSNITVDKWKNYNLNNKIQKIGKYYDKDIESELHKLRKIGNSGAHYGDEVSEEELNKGISIVNKIVLMQLFKYFKKHPFGTEKPVMTIFSSLPPIHRVFILESLSQIYPDNEDIIDKLYPHYLKSGNLQKSINYLLELRKCSIISEEKYLAYNSKIFDLYEKIDEFDISRNVLDVTRIFNLIVSNSYYQEYSEFINIFITLIRGYEIKNN